MGPFQEPPNVHSKLPFSGKIEKDVPLSSIVNSQSEALLLYTKYKESQSIFLEKYKYCMEVDIRVDEIKTPRLSKLTNGLENITSEVELGKLKKAALISASQQLGLVDELTRKMMSLNPLDPGFRDLVNKNITTTASKLDLMYVLENDAENRNAKELMLSFNELYRTKNSDFKFPLEKVVEKYNEVLKYESEIKDYLKYTNKDLEVHSKISALKSKNDYQGALNVIEEYFSNHHSTNNKNQDALITTSTQIKKSEMEKFNYSYPTSAALLNEDTKFTALDNTSKTPLLKTPLWDREIPWKGEIKAEADIRLIQAAYMTEKRLDILSKSLSTALTEVDDAVESRIEKRVFVLNSFWKKYHETGKFLTEELISSIEKLQPKLKDEDISSIAFIKATVDRKLNKDTEDGYQTRLEAKELSSKEVLPSSTLIKNSLNRLLERGQIKISQSALELTRGVEDGSVSIENIEEYLKQSYGEKYLIGDTVYKNIVSTAMPFQAIIEASATIPINGQINLYTSENLHSSKDCSLITKEYISKTSENIKLELQKMNIEDSYIDGILNNFKKLNFQTNEYKIIDKWVEGFKIRFKSNFEPEQQAKK